MTSCENKQESVSSTLKLLQKLSLDAIEAIGISIPAGILVVDAHEKIIYANERASQIFGFNVCGLGFKEYALNIAKARKIENGPYLYEQLPLIKALLYGKITYSQEIVIEKSDKSQVFLTANATPLTDKEGNTSGALAVFEDITDRKRNEQALKESERLYKTLFENTDDAFQIVEPIFDEKGKVSDFRYLRANQAFEIQSGLKISEITGKTVKQVLPNIEPYWLEMYNTVAKTGKPLHSYNYNKDTNRWYDMFLFPYADDQIGVLFRDITERKKTEEELKRSNQKMKEVFESIQEKFWSVDRDWNYTYVSNKAAASLGMKPEQFIGNNLWKLFPAWIGTILEENLKAAMAEGVTKRFETYSTYTKAWQSVSAYPSTDGLVILAIDVTERKKTEEALQRQAALINLSPDAILIRGVDGTVTFWSKGAERMYGWIKEEAIGRVSHELLQTVFPKPLKEIESEMEANCFWTGELTHKTKDGRSIQVQSRWLIESDHNGKKAILETNVDLTYLRKVEADLRGKEHLATIGATAGMVGHDIRNPLQSIMSDTYLLKDALTTMPQSETKDEVTESIDNIEKNISYINKIVADLMDYARPVKVEYTNINLYELMTSIFQHIAIPNNIETSIDIESSWIIKSDNTLLRRILTNLTINAIQAMEDGGKLCLSACPHNDKTLIVVEDTGVGIPEHVTTKLFTPMMTTKSKGQGLGLAVVKRLVEALGGTIGFDSQVGKGTKFVIELPMAQ